MKANFKIFSVLLASLLVGSLVSSNLAFGQKKLSIKTLQAAGGTGLGAGADAGSGPAASGGGGISKGPSDVIQSISFNGGTLGMYLEEVKKTRKTQNVVPFNVIVSGSVSADQVPMPPVVLSSVRVQTAMELIELVIDRNQFLVKISELRGRAARKSDPFLSDTYVVSIVKSNAPRRLAPVRPGPQNSESKQFEIFSLASLRDLSGTKDPKEADSAFNTRIETLLSAVQAAFELIASSKEKKGSALPEIRFHVDSAQLFVLGTAQEVEVVQKVLDHLESSESQKTAHEFQINSHQYQQHKKDVENLKRALARAEVEISSLRAKNKELQDMKAKYEAIMKSLQNAQPRRRFREANDPTIKLLEKTKESYKDNSAKRLQDRLRILRAQAQDAEDAKAAAKKAEAEAKAEAKKKADQKKKAQPQPNVIF